ncbi:haloacid dehalogenase, type II [Lecanosticta acicola]|uniref:Haloacid dehalogenase, type II n=1 Tax=Lecanosticta acicola TaxID=111012 RepID=A0AAI8YZQ0_9PEZI|nr:haloacid dehalogenase, type II [Lecanosticta acicola]
MALQSPRPKALFFDVFGTCVDWRTTVTDALWSAAREALSSPAASLSSRIRIKASDMTYEQWGEVAQEWRNTYLQFTRAIARDPSIPYKTVDQHHLDALRDILAQRELIFPRQGDVPDPLVHDGSLWDEQQILTLSLVWHYLAPWPETNRGLALLNTKFATCTLSNGNVALLTDMVAHGQMPFTHVYSAEMFQSYKPSPKVYRGAAERMGLQPAECVMVAAHLDDLKHAKLNGLRTVYVERPREERVPELKAEGVADVWVGMDEEGFVTAARRLGIEVDS